MRGRGARRQAAARLALSLGLALGGGLDAGAADSPAPPAALRPPPDEWSGLGPLDAPELGPCAIPGETMATRLERRTRPLLGRAYRASPLGEGRGPDDDPRIRFDAFDCTTWVETALALTTCDARTLLERLDAIRYASGRPSFVARRHLVSPQWVPDLESEGVLRRATREAFPEAAETMVFRLGPERWSQRIIARTLELPASAVPEGRFEVDFVPVAHVRTSSASFPVGTVVNVVRVNWSRAPDVVTHQGLVVAADGEVVVRHASVRARRVIDEPVAGFVKRFSAPRKWPVAGFQLLEVTTQAPQPPEGTPR